MAITPASALERITKLQQRNDLYRAMIDGTFALPFANRDDARYQEFKRLLEWSRIDVASVIVETTAERLTVDGFRTDPRSLEGDDRAWELWSKVGGPLLSQLAIIDAVSVGDAFLLGERDEDGNVSLHAETSDNMTVFYAPGSRTKIVGAAKSWVEMDDNGDTWTYLTLYDANEIRRMRKPGPANEGGNWVALNTSGENPLGFVPVTHLRNRPTLAKVWGRSELWGLENDIGRVNKLSADLMVLSEFSSFKVRYATGIEVSTNPAGDPVQPFDVGPDRLLTSENDQARFGTLDETPLDGHLQTVKAMLAQVAALSRTPMFYLSGDLVNLSADALRAMDGQLVSKAMQRQLEMADAFVGAMRMLMLIDGQQPGDTLEVIWKSPEKRSYSEMADSVFKLTSGEMPVLPIEQARIDLGYSPLERERMRSYATQDAARRRAMQAVSPINAVQSRLADARQQQGDQQATA